MKYKFMNEKHKPNITLVVCLGSMSLSTLFCGHIMTVAACNLPPFSMLPY